MIYACAAKLKAAGNVHLKKNIHQMISAPMISFTVSEETVNTKAQIGPFNKKLPLEWFHVFHILGHD